MAGIGFEIRRLSRQETITSVVGAVGHAAVIAAGPWLFTILSLATITVMAESVASTLTLADFRAIVIYSFAVSLVVTAPVTIVATRLVADALWLKNPDAVRSLLFAAFLAAIGIVVPVVAGLSFVFALDGSVAVALTACSLVVALIWVALSFCGAVRDYAGVTISFLAGLLVSLVLAIAAAIKGFHAPGMAWGFLAGLTVTFFGLASRVLATFPQPVTELSAALRALIAGFASYRHLAIGAFLGTAGVWIDKWLFWFSAAGERVQIGLLHAPLYDSAMFIASLVIIPALAAFVSKLETEFFDRYQHYYGTIRSHGTMQQIEVARARLAAYTLDHLALIAVAQVAVSAVLILSAPAIVEFLNLQFRQIAILRFGALGVVFQFIFIAATSMLLFFDRRRLYLGLQGLFLGLNLVLTLVTISLGQDYYGVGYFLACLIAALIAYFLADSTFDRLNYLTFIGNNPSVRESSVAAARSRRTGLKASARDLLARLTPRAPRN